MSTLSPVVPRANAISDSRSPADPEPLRRINDVAAEVGLTTRAIRYYEEQGLLTPSARSSGDYRLYGPQDIERLRAIKGFRDDAGFSLAEIATLLADESAAVRDKQAYHAAPSEQERRAILNDALERLERQLQLLDSKIGRLTEMRAEVDTRAKRVRIRLAEPGTDQ